MKKNDKKIKKIDKKCKKLTFYILKNLEKNCKIFSFSLRDNGFLVDLNVLGPSFESFEFDKKFESLLFCNEKNKKKEEACLYGQAKGSVDVKKMENLIALAEYITDLFNTIGDDCELNQTKLEKLLSIANIVAMKHNCLLFENKVLIKNCGLGIENADDMPLEFKGSIIVGSGVFLPTIKNGDKKEVTIETFSQVEHKEFQFYNDSCYNANETIGALMRQIVAKFFSYTALELGKQIDEFKNKISNTDNRCVDIQCVNEYFKRIDDSLSSNFVYTFIFNYNFQG